jgi:hypothetical protein
VWRILELFRESFISKHLNPLTILKSFGDAGVLEEAGQGVHLPLSQHLNPKIKYYRSSLSL